MGIFRKKEYTLSEALRIIQGQKKIGYDFVPVNPNDSNTKYFIEKTEKVQKRIDALKSPIGVYKKQQESFRNRINGNGVYQNMQETIIPVSKYNDYQSSKGYQKDLEQMYR